MTNKKSSDLLITLCARGGSKGIPGKNIRPLNGKPLIGYSIEMARAFSEIHPADIALSTDSEKIKQVASEFGLTETYTRPKELAGDSAGKIAAISHLLDYCETVYEKRYSHILDLDVTSPLRTLEDLKAAFTKLQNDPDARNIFSVSPAQRNPYFNMVEERADGYVHLVKEVPGEVTSRQKAPPVYDMNASFYIYRRTFFEHGWGTSTTDRSLCFVMNHPCFDLDEPLDFEVMEYLIRENLLDIPL